LAGAECLNVVKTTKALKALRNDWDDLCTRSKCRFSQSYIWCWTTWEAVHRRRKPRLHCITAHDRARLVLIWPFVVYRRPHGYFATPMGCPYGEYPDPLVEDAPDAPRRIEAAWRTLRETCSCDAIRLRHVLDGSELHRLMVRERAKPVSKVANLAVEWRGHDNWESYYCSLDRHDRHDTERRRRRLDELGKVSFEVLEGDECTAAIDWALRRKVEQLDQANRIGGGWLRTKAYRDLLVSAAARGGPQGCLLMFALKLEGQIIATMLCRADQSRLEALNTVYDPAYRRYAAGKIVTLACLKWAFERGLEFDFRNEDAPYKRRWTNRERQAFTYEVPNSMSYTLCHWVPVLTPLIHMYRRRQRKR